MLQYVGSAGNRSSPGALLFWFCAKILFIFCIVIDRMLTAVGVLIGVVAPVWRLTGVFHCLRARYVANVSACLKELTRLPCMSLRAMLLAVKSFLKFLINFHFVLAVTTSTDSLSRSLIHCVLSALAYFVIAL
jgi:hypothetical protein